MAEVVREGLVAVEPVVICVRESARIRVSACVFVFVRARARVDGRACMCLCIPVQMCAIPACLGVQADSLSYRAVRPPVEVDDCIFVAHEVFCRNGAACA
jgi:hypothetical protein